MRNCLLLCVAAALMVGLLGCAADETPPETTVAVIPETTVPPETVPVQTQPEGQMYLTVSEITFSLVGESEDIYIGTVPRDQINWVSGDEAVVTVADGVLTAAGVGSTTVTAQWDEETIEVKVSCLAASQEELDALDEDILRSPKRMPPVVDNPPLEFFDDAAIIGDSISYILFQYETQLGHLGNPLFLARGGTSLNGLVRYYKNV